MDKKLKLLKTYLDSRVASYEKLTGVPLGETVLEMRMLVNSTPGLIRVFVGAGTPAEDRARDIDVWYDLKVFKEKNLTGWRQFDVYQEEFTTTILDAYSDQFPVDVPLTLEIEGPTFINLDLQRTAEYRVYMAMESGQRYPLDEAQIYVQDRSGKILMTVDKYGVGHADFSQVINTTNFKVKARFKLGDFSTLTGELPVQAFLEGTTLNEIYKLFVSGPKNLKVGETGNYTAVLQTTFVETGETTTQDVTDSVAWSVNTDGYISELGAFTPGDNGQLTTVATVSATLTKAMGNGSTFEVIGAADVTITKMAVHEVLVDGPARVKENNEAQYTVRVVFMNGEIRTDMAAAWNLGTESLGSITDGLFKAPMVAADTPQLIQATVEFEGQNHLGEKEIVVENVADPILTISGPAMIYDNETAGFTAQLTFDGQTFDVEPTWGVENAAHGTITNLGVFHAKAQPANAAAKIMATITYKGYTVSAESPLTIYTRKLTPITLTISGATSVVEGNSTNYVAIATMSDNTQRDVTSECRWTIDDSNHTIDGTGLLTAGQVNFDVSVTLQATYSFNGVQQVAVRPVKVIDDPVIWTPQSMTVSGPNSVNEEEKGQYTANVTMKSNRGETQVLTNVPVEWRVDANATIAQTGELTANSVPVTSQAIVTAIYNDGTNLPLTATKTVTIIDVPLLVRLDVIPAAQSIYGGYNTAFEAKLLKKNGVSYDVTSSVDISYVVDKPALVSVDKANKRLVATATETTQSAKVVATYREAGETITGNATLQVMANEAGALLLSPGSIEVFEGETVQLGVNLSLTNGQTANVTPQYRLAAELGSVDASGLFTAASVSADVNGTIVAAYTGPETADQEKLSNEVPVLVKNIAPELLEVYAENGIHVVMEGNKMYLSSKVHFNNGVESVNDLGVTYSVDAADQQYVQLTKDPVTGVLEILGKDVLQDRMVAIKAEFVHPDAPGGKLTATRLITVKYVRQVVGLSLSLAAGPYFNGRNYALTVRERYDDNTLGGAVTSGITWTYDNQILSIVNSIATVIGDSGSFSITAKQGAITSNTVTGDITVNSPVSLEIYSTEGDTIDRDTSTTLSASMRLADGTYVSPSSTWPVTWTLEHENLGTLVTDIDYTALFTAISTMQSGTVKVTATCGSVSSTLTLNVVGFAVPTGATLSGPATVESGKTAQYVLTVTYSDGSTKFIDANSSLTANFTQHFTDPKFTSAATISNKGAFTAPKHAQTSNVSGEIRATYHDVASNQDVTAVPFTVNISPAVPVTPVSAVINGANTVAAGSTQQYVMVVTMSDASTVTINYTSQQTAIWSATRGTINKGQYVAASDAAGYTETITASYSAGGVEKTATKTVTVSPQIATSLIATPLTFSIFENKTQSIEVKTNTGVVVKPVWTSANTTFGTMDRDTGVFTANQVTSDQTATLLGKYSGPETNGVELSVTVSATVRDLTAKKLTIVPVSGTAAVDEEGTATFKAVVEMTDGTTFDATDAVFEITTGSAFATIATDASGICTVTGGNVIQAQNVGLKATYVGADTKSVNGTLTISVRNTIQRVVDVVVDTLQTGTFFEGTTVALRVREKYDDGAYSAPITTGITWTITNTAFASVTGNTATLAQVTGDKVVGFSATVNGRTSSTPFNVTVTDIVPASIAVTSDKGATIARGQSAVFSAKITLNNGTVVDPSAAYPVTWTNNNAAAGTFVAAANKYNYTAANSDIDVTFKVIATAANNVKGEMTATLDGYPIPVSAVINGLAEVAAGSTTDYTMVVTMSDASTRTISATQTTHKAAWTSTHDFTSTGGSIGATTGRLVAGNAWADRLGKVQATYTDSVSGVSVNAEKDVKLLATLVIPTGATMTGPTTLAAGAEGTYELTVTMNNGTTVVINPTSTPKAVWTKTVAGGTLVDGLFTAPVAASPSSGYIKAEYTANGTSISRQIDVTVAAQANVTQPPGSWEDAVYVGTIPTNYDNTHESLVKMILNDDTQESGIKYLNKIANGTKLFPFTTINIDRWTDAAGTIAKTGPGGTVNERACVMYPKKYGKARFNELAAENNPFGLDGIFNGTVTVADTVTDADGNPVNPQVANLLVNGQAMEFYVYRMTTGPSASLPRLTINLRSVP